MILAKRIFKSAYSIPSLVGLSSTLHLSVVRIALPRCGQLAVVHNPAMEGPSRNLPHLSSGPWFWRHRLVHHCHTTTSRINAIVTYCERCWSCRHPGYGDLQCQPRASTRARATLVPLGADLSLNPINVTEPLSSRGFVDGGGAHRLSIVDVPLHVTEQSCFDPRTNFLGVAVLGEEKTQERDKDRWEHRWRRSRELLWYFSFRIFFEDRGRPRCYVERLRRFLRVVGPSVCSRTSRTLKERWDDHLNMQR